MKKKLVIAGISLVAATALVLGLMFVKCDGTQEQKTVAKIYLGGLLIDGTSSQLLAKIAVGVPHDKTDYKARIEGLPESLKVLVNNGIRVGYYEIDFIVEKVAGQGDYPYKITIENPKEKHEFEGILSIAASSDSPDRVGGNPGKTGYLGELDMNALAIVAKVNLGKIIVSNPVIESGTIIAATSAGEIAGISLDGKLKWKVQVTKDIIETLQAVDGNVIASDNSGKISLYSIKGLEAGNKNPESSHRIGGMLSGPCTVMNKSNLVAGTTDGLVLCLSLPDLEKVWEVKLAGSIMGPIASIPLGGGKGQLYFNCSDNNTYIVQFDGTLAGRLQSQNQLLGSPIAMTDRFAVNVMPNQLQLREAAGKEKWIHYCEFDVAGSPLMSTSQVFVYGRTKLRSVSMIDGTENWTVDMQSTINSKPVLIGTHILVPTEDKSISVIRVNDGITTNTIRIDGSVVPWPFASGQTLVVNDRIGNVLVFGKEKQAQGKKFDLSQVVVNGGAVNIAHNSVVGAALPQKPKLLWTLDGSHAPAVTTTNRIFVYNIDKKAFSCLSAVDGQKVWELEGEAVDGMYYGFGLDRGPHDTPMFFTAKGLLLGMKAGLALVDPETGIVLAKSLQTGIPQSDGKLIVLADGRELRILDMDMKPLWMKEGEYFPANVCIDGDFIFAARRGENRGAFQILEAKTGKVILEQDDRLFDISSIKMLVTKRYAIVSTLMGPWVFDKEKANIHGTSGSLSQSGLKIAQCNEVNGKLYCVTEEYGITFNLQNGEAAPIIPRDAMLNKLRVTGGNWLFTPTSYLCMGVYIEDEKKITENGETPVALQIRNLDGTTVSTTIFGKDSIKMYGISASASLIIVSEIGNGAKLKVYGP